MLPFVPPPSESISGLLLESDRIVVLATGYAFVGEPVIGEYTRVLIYQVDSGGKLDLLDETLVAGSYRAAREREGSAHVVTLSPRPRLADFHVVPPIPVTMGEPTETLTWVPLPAG